MPPDNDMGVGTAAEDSKGGKKRHSTGDSVPPPPPPGRPPPKCQLGHLGQLNQLNQPLRSKPVTAARSKVASPVVGGGLGLPPGLGASVVELAQDLAANNSQNKKVTWLFVIINLLSFEFVSVLINQK